MQKVIITGVTGGLGNELARQFLAKNHSVVGISRTKPELNISHIKADLTQERDISKVIAQIKKEHSDFNILVNCAGVFSEQPVNAITYAEMEALLKLNLMAPMMLSSGLIDLVKQNEADIVNVGSTIAFKTYEKQMAYTASKWALRGVTTNLQLELKNSKSRVIGFNPGGFKSRIFEKATGKEITDWSAWMDPKDLAAFIISILDLPRNMEVSEVVINRK